MVYHIIHVQQKLYPTILKIYSNIEKKMFIHIVFDIRISYKLFFSFRYFASEQHKTGKPIPGKKVYSMLFVG